MLRFVTDRWGRRSGRQRRPQPAPPGTAGPLDLAAVEDLCRLALAANRLGCRVRLEGASDELRALLALVGVDALLLGEPPGMGPGGGPLRCTR